MMLVIRRILMLTQTEILLGLLAFAGLGLVLLSVIAFKQQQRIKFLTTPKYGFMGKQLAVFGFILLAGSGFIIFNNQPANAPTSISVSDTDKIELAIEYEVIDDKNNIYKFNATPIINNNRWDLQGELDIEWKLNGEFVGNENQISKNNPGGINIELNRGLNYIEVSTYIGSFYTYKDTYITVE